MFRALFLDGPLTVLFPVKDIWTSEQAPCGPCPSSKISLLETLHCMLWCLLGILNLTVQGLLLLVKAIGTHEPPSRLGWNTYGVDPAVNIAALAQRKNHTATR